MTQHKLMIKFMRERGLSQTFSLADCDKWIKAWMPEYYTQITSQPIKTRPLDDTIWPVLYKGLNHYE